MDIRKITISKTFGEISGFPFQKEDKIDLLKFQKLDQRMESQKYNVLKPELISQSDGYYRFPKYEFIVQIFNHPESIILYNDIIPGELENWIKEKTKTLL